MEISIRDKKLRKSIDDPKKLVREYGAKMANILQRRLDDLYNADTLEDTRNLPGRYHELRGNKKEYWACDLEQPYRLIFTPRQRPIPQNEDGQYIWVEIVAIEITEIDNYHKEK